MSSRSTITQDAETPHFQVTERYSWGGNMDHTEYWVDCTACGAQLMHSDFGGYEDDDDLDVHRTQACVARKAEWDTALSAAAALDQTFALFATPDNQPF